MDPNLFTYIWQHSRREQMSVIAIVLLSLPFYYLSLNLPKLIVNGPIQGKGFESEGATQPFLEIVIDLFGAKATLFEGWQLERMDSLFALSFLFLGLVCVNGLFKFQINTLKGRMGERLLRRLRYELVDRVLRFPLPYFRRVKQAEIASMVKDEVEPLGGFVGDAFALPLFLGGQAITALAFILVQSFWLGLIAAGVVLVQAFVIPRLRRPILRLGRMRQLQARDLAGRVGEIVDGIADIRAHDTTNYQRADMTARLSKIFFIRFELYQRKFFVKFLNNFLAQVTPFIFYALGGYLAIMGQLSIGELVAVIAAYKELPAPIKDLIDWDLQRKDAQIKYEQVAEQFHPEGMIAPELQAIANAPPPPLGARFVFRDVTASDEAGGKLLDSVTLDVDARAHTAFTGLPGQGKEAAAQLIARLATPRIGQVLCGGLDWAHQPDHVAGRRIGYVGPDAYLFPGNVRANILYGLMHAPGPSGPKPPLEESETQRSGNAPYDIDADWIDYEAAGIDGPDAVDARLLKLLPIADFEAEIYQLGLLSRVDPETDGGMAEKALIARRTLRERLSTPEFENLVEPFDALSYNRNATLAENLLFGSPVSATFAWEDLMQLPEVAAVLEANGLSQRLLEAGRDIAETMVELFRDLPADHPFFEQFSFIKAAEMPVYQALLSRPGGAVLSGDGPRLVALALRYVEARHRLGVIDPAMRDAVIGVRAPLREAIEAAAPGSVAFYDADAFNGAASLQDNILFGRVAFGVAGAGETIQRLIAQVLDDLGLRTAVLGAGLSFDVGAAGRRLSPSQRQKIALLRALIKRPDLLVVNQGLAVLDGAAQADIRARVLAMRQGQGVIWTLPKDDPADGFTRIIAFENGRVARDALRGGEERAS